MQLQFFEYKEGESHNNVRTAEIDGEIWFVGVDIANVLQYQRPNEAIRQHCKHTVKHRISDNQGVPHEYLVIPESDVYRLIIKSQMPRAEKFEDWIFSEVIPSIRKTGRYGVTPVFVRRFNDNWARVERGYFSIISELFIRVYGKLEQAGHLIPDKAPDGKEIRPDTSVGKTFPTWLEKKYPELVNKFKYYRHLLPNGLEVDARQYENEVLPMFIEYIENDWLYNRAKDYFQTRDPKALNYLPKILEGKSEVKKLSPFDKHLKGLLDTPPAE
jgi:prophage antirepressor-like protein